MHFIADCESLIRKMLVRDPERRCTVSAIKRHRWMQVDVPAEEHAEAAAAAVAEAVAADAGQRPHQQRRSQAPINEGLLMVMADLGIDTNVTKEVTSSTRSKSLGMWNTHSLLSGHQERCVRSSRGHILLTARQLRPRENVSK